MTPARFRWGLFLILMGVLLLLRNFDVLNDNFWIDLLILFPVVLIAVGIEKIFSRTRLRVISYLTSVALFVGGLAIAFNSGHGGESTSFFSTTTYRQEGDPGVHFMRAVIDVDESDLTIRDSGNDLVYAKFDRFTRKPEIDFVRQDSAASLEMVGRGGGVFGGAVKIESDESPDWFVQFSGTTPLELNCTGHQSDLHLNLSTTPLRMLKIDADESTVYLKVGDLLPLVTVTVGGDDTELRLRVPKTVGLKVRGEDYREYLDKVGMIEADSGAGFVTAGYDTTGNKVDVDVDDRLNSFSIDFF